MWSSFSGHFVVGRPFPSLWYSWSKSQPLHHFLDTQPVTGSSHSVCTIGGQSEYLPLCQIHFLMHPPMLTPSPVRKAMVLHWRDPVLEMNQRWVEALRLLPQYHSALRAAYRITCLPCLRPKHRSWVRGRSCSCWCCQYFWPSHHCRKLRSKHGPATTVGCPDPPYHFISDHPYCWLEIFLRHMKLDFFAVPISRLYYSNSKC